MVVGTTCEVYIPQVQTPAYELARPNFKERADKQEVKNRRYFAHNLDEIAPDTIL